MAKQADVIQVEASPELRELRALEMVIEQTQDAARANLEAWKAIIDRKLYRAAGYSSLDAYCKRRWGHGERQARQNLQLAKVAEEIEQVSAGEILPGSGLLKSHLAELAPYEPSKRKEILEVAMQTAPGGKLTAGWIEQTARRLNEAELAAAKEAREQRKAQEEDDDEGDEEAEDDSPEDEPEEEEPEVSEETQAIADAAAHPIVRAPDVAKLEMQAKRWVAKGERLALALDCTPQDLLERFGAG